MNLDSLALFAKVAEVNGFSAAARHLSMPIATVRRRIAGFEDELGVCLLERTTRGLRLTDVGWFRITALSCPGRCVCVRRPRSSRYCAARVRLSGVVSGSARARARHCGGAGHLEEDVDVAFRLGPQRSLPDGHWNKAVASVAH